MKRALSFAIAAIVLLYAIRELEYAGLRRNQKGEFAKLREAFLEPHPCDILILGSSRAECQFYPPIIDSKTGMRTFNLGMTGATPPFIRTSLEAYLENSPAPKFVLLNLDIHSLTDNPDTVYKFPRYFAYLSNKKLKDGLQEHDKRFTAFQYFAPYSMPYFGSHYLDASLHGWLNTPGKYDLTYNEGFTPCESISQIINYDTIQMPELNTKIPAFVWNELDSISKICSKNKIRLILVLSPVHESQRKKILNYSKLESDLRSYSVNHGIQLINLGNNSISSDQKYYADPAHLNYEGAMLFTSVFSDSLVQYIR